MNLVIGNFTTMELESIIGIKRLYLSCDFVTVRYKPQNYVEMLYIIFIKIYFKFYQTNVNNINDK